MLRTCSLLSRVHLLPTYGERLEVSMLIPGAQALSFISPSKQPQGTQFESGATFKMGQSLAFYGNCGNIQTLAVLKCLPGGPDGKKSVCSAGDPGSLPGLGRHPGEENGYPLQYSRPENSMDRGAWWATVHGVTKSQA